jgi:hypothetical protein
MNGPHRLVRLAPEPRLPPLVIDRARRLRSLATPFDPQAGWAWHYYRMAICDLTGATVEQVEARL